MNVTKYISDNSFHKPVIDETIPSKGALDNAKAYPSATQGTIPFLTDTKDPHPYPIRDAKMDMFSFDYKKNESFINDERIEIWKVFGYTPKAFDDLEIENQRI